MAAVSTWGHARLVWADFDYMQASAQLDAFVPEMNHAHTYLRVFSQEAPNEDSP